ncbi:hypothetical protein BDW74DRAFT_182629 [Aspergillus multicolor]|uniref:O-methyltransferase tpcA n=1 Tax=Aspergillus multicolor TaxID=41759 RepID=UPI003CCDCA26
MGTIREAAQLLQLLNLTQDAAHTIIAEWAKQVPAASNEADSDSSLPSRELFEARRTLIAATGKFTELVAAPSERLLEVSSQYNEARCLHITVSMRIADLLAAGEEKGTGVSIESLSSETGIQAQKLCRIMRCLCSIHIFQEIKENVFANNNISAALVGNDPLRAYILMFAWDLYSASDALPRTLLDPDFGSSYLVTQTAFQKAVHTSKERWNWLEEDVTSHELANGDFGQYPGPFGPEVLEIAKGPAADKVKRPEHGTFGLAMLGGGRITGVAHLYDFPWETLGEATVVDVGGGVGGFCLQLSRLYPKLKFVVQDRGPVLKQAQTDVWPAENPQALKEQRVQFVEHNFFEANPVKGADIYWLRYILHDWSDEYCVQILSAVRNSMDARSRILICDQVMNTTVGFVDQTNGHVNGDAQAVNELRPAPAPLPANYGYYTRYSHQRDITMMSIINGIERTPAEFERIITQAGLAMTRIYDCRSQVALVECRLPV